MIHAVIMAGGKGTRFWPLSRECAPKQFLEILTQKTLLEETITRIRPYIKRNHTWVVTNKAHAIHLKAFSCYTSPDHILYEPTGKNTAASIGWAAIEILKQDPDGIMVVLPADHYITPSESFRKVLQHAARIVKQDNQLVTIGITPTNAHTGYGYIEVADNSAAVKRVLCFHEKPSIEQATGYLKKGSFYWNSGIFIWKASTILELINTHMPEHGKILQKISQLTPPQHDELDALFSQFESISIDYGVMEHVSSQISLLSANFTWSDIGSWCALGDFLPQDIAHNASKNPLISLNSSDNLVYSSKLVAFIDTHNMIVVDTPDAILILPKSSDQRIKELYDQLPKEYQ